MFYPLALVALVGHVSLAVASVNRLHGLGWPRPLLKVCDAFWCTFTFGVPFGIAAWHTQNLFTGHPPDLGLPLTQGVYAYLAVATLACLVAVAVKLDQILTTRTTPLLKSNHTRRIDLIQQLGKRPVGTMLTQWLSRLPYNEIFMLDVRDKTIVLPRLAPQLGGLTITHLSDLHMTGQLTPPFYDEIVRQSNKLASDIVVITGDIVEKKACLPWIATSLGQLVAPHGVYFVLGNHEQRLGDELLIRRTLTDAGLIDLGGHLQRIEINGCPIVLAGNERPWYQHPPELRNIEGPSPTQPILRIGLAHSPDQLPWARANELDLLLAGHTHGGQVRLPLLGPVFAPSLRGVTHASGTFYVEPTLLHVSRGLSGVRPVRVNCAPELARLVIQSPVAT